MALMHAPALGIDRFAVDREREPGPVASGEDRAALIHAVYRQVLGHQYVMENERLAAIESLFRHGDLSVREFVRCVAKSHLYRSRFFDNCNPYRFIELNHKHLLGRAPRDRAEMLHHFTLLQKHGYDAEIDSYIDSAEYQERFGQDGVPYLHGWDYSAGQEGRQFSWLMRLARGAAASAKGDAVGSRWFSLGRALHENRPIPVPGGVGRVVIVSTEGPFQALVSTDPSLPAEVEVPRPLRTPSAEQRREALGSGGGTTGGGDDRLATLTVTGVARNAYARSGATTLRVPVARLNQALQRCQRLGGRVVRVAVNGRDVIVAGSGAAGEEGRD
ncbi:MAG: phycobilisome rod-core linker polypeptide [Synechococcaceae cyanobacterium]|nr:phycobilisome rod-core linker polypeptide [Synechococcaceae cyanobacterium]